METSYLHFYLLGLGSNLGPSRQTFLEAFALIGQTVGPVVDQAPLYETPPQGGVADRVFLNSALLCRSNLSPDECMLQLLEIENRLGRRRQRQWDNRTIDLDILMGVSLPSKMMVHQTPLATIPHPLLLERDFALVPSAQLVPHWIHPHSGQTLQEEVRLRSFSLDDCEKSHHW
jgi:2-amino-4-hydroxy-6-hydroxymethyldihydropteridine diphosphokinase